MGLEVNQDETKYLVTTRIIRDNSDRVVENYIFQQVKDFKYLGVSINQHNNMYYDIKLRIYAVNKGYYALENVFKSSLLSRLKKKEYTLCSSYLRPVLIYA